MEADFNFRPFTHNVDLKGAIFNRNPDVRLTSAAASSAREQDLSIDGVAVGVVRASNAMPEERFRENVRDAVNGVLRRTRADYLVDLLYSRARLGSAAVASPKDVQREIDEHGWSDCLTMNDVRESAAFARTCAEDLGPEPEDHLKDRLQNSYGIKYPPRQA